MRRSATGCSTTSIAAVADARRDGVPQSRQRVDGGGEADVGRNLRLEPDGRLRVRQQVGKASQTHGPAPGCPLRNRTVATQGTGTCDIGVRNVSGRKAILIAGPTAGGKSAFALRLAERHGGVVINADSMAVYRDLSVLTGRPVTADLARVPHRLYGHRDGAEPYSVGHWLVEAETEIRRAWALDALPIVVGGTGLYFKALTQGLSHIPAVPADLRTRIRAEAEGLAPDVLHARLAARDPATAARLRPTDPQRILRAWEILEATGRSLSSFQALRSAPLLPMSDVTGLVLSPDRENCDASSTNASTG